MVSFCPLHYLLIFHSPLEKSNFDIAIAKIVVLFHMLFLYDLGFLSGHLQLQVNICWLLWAFWGLRCTDCCGHVRTIWPLSIDCNCLIIVPFLLFATYIWQYYFFSRCLSVKKNLWANCVKNVCFSRCGQHTERDPATGVWRDTAGASSGQDLPAETDNLYYKKLTRLYGYHCEQVFASGRKDTVPRRPRRSTSQMRHSRRRGEIYFSREDPFKEGATEVCPSSGGVPSDVDSRLREGTGSVPAGLNSNHDM